MLFKDTKNVILLIRINYNSNSRTNCSFWIHRFLLQKYLPIHWVTVSIRKLIFQSSSLGTQNPWTRFAGLCLLTVREIFFIRWAWRTHEICFLYLVLGKQSYLTNTLYLWLHLILITVQYLCLQINSELGLEIMRQFL